MLLIARSPNQTQSKNRHQLQFKCAVPRQTAHRIVCLSICVFFLILRFHRSILVSTPFSTRVFEGSPKKHFGVDCFYIVQSSSLRMWSTQRKTQGGKAKSRNCGGRREFVGGVVDRWNKLLQRGGSPSKAVSHVLSCMTGNLNNFFLMYLSAGGLHGVPSRTWQPGPPHVQTNSILEAALQLIWPAPS